MISHSLLPWLIRSPAWKQAAARLLISSSNHNMAIFLTVCWVEQILWCTEPLITTSVEQRSDINAAEGVFYLNERKLKFPSLSQGFYLIRWGKTLLCFSKHCVFDRECALLYNEYRMGVLGLQRPRPTAFCCYVAINLLRKSWSIISTYDIQICQLDSTGDSPVVRHRHGLCYICFLLLFFFFRISDFSDAFLTQVYEVTTVLA